MAEGGAYSPTAATHQMAMEIFRLTFLELSHFPYLNHVHSTHDVLLPLKFTESDLKIPVHLEF